MKKITTILLLFITTFQVYAQTIPNDWWQITELASMPMPVANNTVTEGFDANGKAYIYSFGGIDSTKIWSGITLKSFRYDIANDVWDTLPNLPDTLGKIASGASFIDSIIYIIGGYHVFANSNEISSAKVHRFNTHTNTYMSDGMDIPVPIDDHVQAIYKDSLIFIVTGWSNTSNVTNVQIYDAKNNNWLTGTSTPNNNIYKAFGATGTILGDTLYYHGGASTGFNFPGQNTLRKGYINPTNPTQITWSFSSTPYVSYRAIAFPFNGKVHFIGGSDVTYNFNGIAYNGSGGVNPNNRAFFYDKINGVIDTNLITDNVPTPFTYFPMDLRGYGHVIGSYYVAGGMLSNQKVSNKLFRLDHQFNVSSVKENNTISFKTFPNPSNQHINLIFQDVQKKALEITDLNGKIVFQLTTTDKKVDLDVSTYSKGVYLLKITAKNKIGTQKIIVE